MSLEMELLLLLVSPLLLVCWVMTSPFWLPVLFVDLFNDYSDT